MLAQLFPQIQAIFFQNMGRPTNCASTATKSAFRQPTQCRKVPRKSTSTCSSRGFISTLTNSATLQEHPSWRRRSVRRMIDGFTMHASLSSAETLRRWITDQSPDTTNGDAIHQRLVHCPQGKRREKRRLRSEWFQRNKLAIVFKPSVVWQRLWRRFSQSVWAFRFRLCRWCVSTESSISSSVRQNTGKRLPRPSSSFLHLKLNQYVREQFLEEVQRHGKRREF